MNFRERKIAYEQLKGEVHFDADKALLKEVDPSNDFLKKPVFKKDKLQLEILWALLEKVSREDIVVNRREFSKKKEETVSSNSSEESKKTDSHSDQAIDQMNADKVPPRADVPASKPTPTTKKKYIRRKNHERKRIPEDKLGKNK